MQLNLLVGGGMSTKKSSQTKQPCYLRRVISGEGLLQHAQVLMTLIDSITLGLSMD